MVACNSAAAGWFTCDAPGRYAPFTALLTEHPVIVRIKGTRNAGFDQRSAALLARLGDCLRQRGAAEPTLRDMAAACGCSVSTLKHYFGGRRDIILAVFADTHVRSERHLAHVRQPSGPLAQSVRDAVLEAWVVLTNRRGTRMLAAGMAEGMGDPALGPGYLQDVFDPYIHALSARLATHMARGEMRAADPRMAAMMLASPLLLAAFHQRELDGVRVWPIDPRVLVDHVAEGFLRAFGTGPEAAVDRPPATGDDAAGASDGAT